MNKSLLTLGIIITTAVSAQGSRTIVVPAAPVVNQQQQENLTTPQVRIVSPYEYSIIQYKSGNRILMRRFIR